MKIFKTKESFDNNVHTKRYYFCGIRYLKKHWAHSWTETFLLKIKTSAHYFGDSYRFSQKYRNNNPMISIIVTSYNYANYIKETLDSLIAQTYKNFEIIVVDDGSRDDSLEIINEYVKKYPCIKLYRHPKGKNKGLPASIKLGIANARGDYIAFCESDDAWMPEHLQEKVKIISNIGAVFIVNNVMLFGNPTQKYKEYIKNGLENLPTGLSMCNVIDNNPIASFSCVMIKKDILQKCNFNTIIPAWIDWWLYRQILSSYPIYYINKRITKWRIHESYNSADKSTKYLERLGAFIRQNNKLITKQKYTREHYKLIKQSQYWDKRYYISLYKDKLRDIDPILHFLYIGWKQGYNPSIRFNTNAYLSSYIDVLQMNCCPLLHYEMSGKKEKRTVYALNKYREYSIENFLNLDTNKNRKIILLFSHELSLTGAPRALLHLALSLKKQGFYPVIIAWKYGDMEKEIVNNGIDLVVELCLYTKLLARDSVLLDFLSKANLILFNSLSSLLLLDVFPKLNIKKIAWIHEGKDSYQSLDYIMDFKQSFNGLDFVYCVGNYSKSFADKYLPKQKKAGILLYGIPDVNNLVSNIQVHNTNCVKFILPGMLSERKGHDILLKAIAKIPDIIKKQMIIYIAGPSGDANIEKNILRAEKQYNNVKYLHSVPHDELMALYRDIDVVLCPSRDDPMPIVCTEAFALNKIVIVSENTGTASFIQNTKNGFVISAEDVDSLADAMIYVIKHKKQLTSIGKKARKIYDDNFSEATFDKNVKQIFNHFIK